MEQRQYKGVLIKKELSKNKNNHFLLIKFTTTQKNIFCFSKTDISDFLKVGKEYIFYDSQKYQGKFYFLDNTKEIESQRWQEIKDFQIKQLEKKYRIQSLNQLEKRLQKLEHKKRELEYWALLIIKHKKYLAERVILNEQEQEEKKLLNFITQNWNIRQSLFGWDAPN